MKKLPDTIISRSMKTGLKYWCSILTKNDYIRDPHAVRIALKCKQGSWLIDIYKAQSKQSRKIMMLCCHLKIRFEPKKGQEWHQ